MSAMNTKKAVSRELYDEACTELEDILEENRRLNEACRFMSDYIHQKGLDAEFELFRQTAHEESASNLPFPRLVMDSLQRAEPDRNSHR